MLPELMPSIPAIDCEEHYNITKGLTYPHCVECGEVLDNAEDIWCRNCDTFDHGGMDEI